MLLRLVVYSKENPSQSKHSLKGAKKKANTEELHKVIFLQLLTQVPKQNIYNGDSKVRRKSVTKVHL